MYVQSSLRMRQRQYKQKHPAIVPYGEEKNKSGKNKPEHKRSINTFTFAHTHIVHEHINTQTHTQTHTE